MEEKETNIQQLDFAAIDAVREFLVEAPEERRMGSEWVRWGTRNTFPQYIDDLSRTTPTLRVVILGLVDYICGDGVTATHGLSGRESGAFDRRGTLAADLVRKTAESIARWGGFAWKITLNNDLATVGEIEVIPLKYLRADEDEARFWYSEKWGKSDSGRVVYDRWIPGTTKAETIFYCKLWGDGIYPEPIVTAVIKDCETERGISDYHLGNIVRGFMPSFIVNFNNGANPTDKEKAETEKNFTRKFAGVKNAGRIAFSWNPNVQGRTTFEKMDTADFSEKYKALSQHCRQQIFAAYRANPNLFGLASEQQTGFNTEEYDSAFTLFNRTMVKPIQARIIDAMEKVTGEKGIITISPFTLDGAEKEVR